MFCLQGTVCITKLWTEASKILGNYIDSTSSRYPICPNQGPKQFPLIPNHPLLEKKWQTTLFFLLRTKRLLLTICLCPCPWTLQLSLLFYWPNTLQVLCKSPTPTGRTGSTQRSADLTAMYSPPPSSWVAANRSNVVALSSFDFLDEAVGVTSSSPKWSRIGKLRNVI